MPWQTYSLPTLTSLPLGDMAQRQTRVQETPHNTARNYVQEQHSYRDERGCKIHPSEYRFGSRKVEDTGRLRPRRDAKKASDGNIHSGSSEVKRKVANTRVPEYERSPDDWLGPNGLSQTQRMEISFS